MRRVERFIEIDAPVERVFEAFGDFENFPEWMSGIGEVRRAGRYLTHWATAVERSRRPLLWETEMTIFQPDHRIAWRSVRGDVETDGEAIFEETRRHTTVLRVILGYDLPHARSRENDDAGPLFGRQFERVLEDDLKRFKRIIERRAERAQHRQRPIADRDEQQAVGYRGRPDKRDLRHRVEEETFRQPRSDENYYREKLHMRGRDDERAREMNRRSDTEGRRAHPASRADYEEDELRRERGFDEALRAARQSQRESLRRYEDDTRHQRAERERNERIAADRLEAVRPHLRDRRLDEVDARPPRRDSALRERDTRQQETSDEYTLHRGIDRLLDDAPSRNWRR